MNVISEKQHKISSGREELFAVHFIFHTCLALLVFLPVHKYSTKAVMQAMPRPANSTTKIPPTLAMLSDAAFPLSDFSCNKTKSKLASKVRNGNVCRWDWLKCMKCCYQPTSHCPPPLIRFHHFSFKRCNFPPSCSWRIALVIGVR